MKTFAKFCLVAVMLLFSVESVFSQAYLDAQPRDVRYDVGLNAIVFDVFMRAGTGYISGNASAGRVQAADLKYDIFLRDTAVKLAPTASFTSVNARHPQAPSGLVGMILASRVSVVFFGYGDTVVGVNLAMGFNTTPARDFGVNWDTVARVIIPVISETKPTGEVFVRQRNTALPYAVTSTWSNSVAPGGGIYDQPFTDKGDVPIESCTFTLQTDSSTIDQVVCLGSDMDTVIYKTGGSITAIAADGLPSNVEAILRNDSVFIYNKTPFVSAPDTFEYVIKSACDCISSDTIKGRIIVYPRTSAANIWALDTTFCGAAGDVFLDDLVSSDIPDSTFVWYASLGSWTPMSSALIPPPAVTTTYYVAVKSPVHCEGTNDQTGRDSVTVWIAPAAAATLNFTDTTICANNPTHVSIKLTGVTGTVQWQDSTVASGHWTTFTPSVNQYEHQPAITDTTWYRVIVKTSCDSIVNVIRVATYPRAIGGTLSPKDTTICAGGTATIIQTGRFGNDFLWEYVDSMPGTFGPTEYPTLTSDIGILQPTVTTWYRVRARNKHDGMNYCNSVYSDTVKITVDPKPTATANFSDSSICSGNPLATILVLTHDTGSIQWQDSIIGGTWQEIASAANAHQYEVPSITDTTWYRAILKSGVCDDSVVRVFRMAVIPDPNKGTVSLKDTTICQGENVDLAITGYTGTLKWEYTTDLGGTLFAADASPVTTSTYSATSLIDTTWYRVEIKTLCGTIYSDTIKVTVTPPSAATPNFSDSTICEGNPLHTTLVLTGVTGDVQWEDSTTASGIWHTFTPSVNQYAHEVPSTATDTVWYRATIRSGACDSVVKVFRVAVIPDPIAGTLSLKDTTICEGEDVDLAVTGYAGSLGWEYTTDLANPVFTAVSPSVETPTFNTTALTDTTWYRVRISTSCGIVYSDTAKITVSPTPAATANFSDSTICAGNPLGATLVLTGVTGSVQWEDSTTASGTWTTFIPSVNQYEHEVSSTATDTVWYRATIRSGVCDSITREFRVAILPIVGLVLPKDTTICAGQDVEFTVTGFVGDVEWEYSTTAPVGPYTLTSVTLPTYNTGPLTDTTWFRVRLETALCGPVYSDTIKVAVRPLADAAWIACSMTIDCDTNIYFGNPVELNDMVYPVLPMGGGLEPIINPKFHWYENLTDPTSAEMASSYLLLGDTTTYYVSLSGDNYCESINRDSVRVNIIKNPDEINFDWYPGPALCFYITGMAAGEKFDVDWGDGNVERYTAEGKYQKITHGYTIAGPSVHVTITGVATCTFTALNIANSGLTTLDISKAPHLRTLYCENNKIEVLTLHTDMITVVQCFNNSLNLSSLFDISQRIVSPVNKRLGTHSIGVTVAAGTLYTFDANVLGGQTTVWTVTGSGTYTGADGEYTFDPGTYTVTATNAAIISKSEYPVTVTWEVTVP